MMNIAERIINKINTFEIMIGFKPSAVYLGRREHKELRTFYEVNIGQPVENLQILGIEVYEVKMKYHIGVGYSSKNRKPKVGRE